MDRDVAAFLFSKRVDPDRDSSSLLTPRFRRDALNATRAVQ
jgi:hypothetical protein